MAAVDRAADRLTVEVWSPLHCRPWRISQAQFRVLVRVSDGGYKDDQRTLAAAVGMSLAGLNRALESLVAGGILSKVTRR